VNNPGQLCNRIRCDSCTGCIVDNITIRAFCRDRCQEQGRYCDVRRREDGLDIRGCVCNSRYLPVGSSCVHQDLIIGLTAGIGAAIILSLIIALIIAIIRPCSNNSRARSYVNQDNGYEGLNLTRSGDTSAYATIRTTDLSTLS